MPDFTSLMKQAAQLQAKMEAMQAELGQIEVEGTAGGGAVTVKLTAKTELKSVAIDASLLRPEDKEIVEYEQEQLGHACLHAGRELVLAALNGKEFDIEAKLTELRRLAHAVRLGPSTRSITSTAPRPAFSISTRLGTPWRSVARRSAARISSLVARRITGWRPLRQGPGPGRGRRRA